MGTTITLPPTSRYLGSRVTATWHNGHTATGVLTVVREDGITIHACGANHPIPYEAIASLRLVEGDPVGAEASGPPFAEDRDQLNDTRDQLMKHIAELPNVTGVTVHPAAAGVFTITYTDRPAVLVDLWHA